MVTGNIRYFELGKEEKNFTISVVMLFPKTRASPEVGGRRPTSMEMVVLLPAPL